MNKKLKRQFKNCTRNAVNSAYLYTIETNVFKLKRVIALFYHLLIINVLPLISYFIHTHINIITHL